MNILTLFNNPIRWLIFVEMLLKWSVQVRSSEKVIPKYLKVCSRASSCSLTCIEMLVNASRRLLLPKRTNLDLVQYGIIDSHFAIAKSGEDLH